MEDLIRYDNCREEVALLRSSIENLRAINTTCLSYAQELETQKKLIEWRLLEADKIEKHNRLQYEASIINLKAQFKKEKTIRLS